MPSIRTTTSARGSSVAPASTAATFQPQPLDQPLNDTAINALKNLGGLNASLERFEKLLASAVTDLTEVTGKLNDRAYERRTSHRKQLQRLRDNGEEMDTEMIDAHENFQQQTTAMTKKLDMSMRSIVDHRTWLQDLRPTITATTHAAQGSATQVTDPVPSPTPLRSQRVAHNSMRVDDDDDDDDDEGEENSNNAAPRSQTRSQLATHHPADTPHIMIQAALQKQAREWASKSLIERYAQDNDYRGFRRVLYDAQNPGEEAPPMPHERFWFAAEEDFAMNSIQRGGDSGDGDSEIEVERERISIKCPITLLPFEEPVTSAMCGHSYEKSAIFAMLRTTDDHVPFTEEQLIELSQLNRRDRPQREKEIGIPQVICPKCNVPVTEANLKSDPALKRRVQRILAAQRQAADASSDVESEQDIAPGQTQRHPVGVGSSPAGTARSARRMKMERGGSTVPQTQL